jgi:DNA-binding GntR family transcriptional regulator
MAKTATGTRVDAVLEEIRTGILAGRLRPGDRLKFPALSEEFGVSAGVIREALGRLVEQGFVQMQPHQGFQVTPLSVENLQELTEARVAIESMVLRLSIETGDLDWETGAVAAHHKLARTPTQLPDDPETPNPDWDEVHAAFHRALLAGCPNQRLLEIAMRLRGESELYRHWSLTIGHDSSRDPEAEHRRLLEAAVARDTDLAVSLLTEHIWAPARRLIELEASESAAQAV